MDQEKDTDVSIGFRYSPSLTFTTPVEDGWTTSVRIDFDGVDALISLTMDLIKELWNALPEKPKEDDFRRYFGELDGDWRNYNIERFTEWMGDIIHRLNSDRKVMNVSDRDFDKEELKALRAENARMRNEIRQKDDRIVRMTTTATAVKVSE